MRVSWRKGHDRNTLKLVVMVARHCEYGSVGKESTCNARDSGLIPGLGRFPGEGISYPFQYSGQENSIDCIVHGVTKSQTQLSDIHFTKFYTLKGEI